MNGLSPAGAENTVECPALVVPSRELALPPSTPGPWWPPVLVGGFPALWQLDSAQMDALSLNGEARVVVYPALAVPSRELALPPSIPGPWWPPVWVGGFPALWQLDSEQMNTLLLNGEVRESGYPVLALPNLRLESPQLTPYLWRDSIGLEVFPYFWS